MTGEPIAVGGRVGDYEVTGRIGAGGMGEVFRARDTRLGRDVAIKVLPTQYAADAERRQRFEREARFLAALNHPNIGAIYGFIAIGDSSGLVLEYINGPTLAERAGGRPLPIGESLAIARQLAAALDAAHQRGIVHRDLKPSNIKLTASGVVKVLDFGIAKAFALGGDATVTRTADGTRAGSVVGTIGYMSPEQARGLDVDKRADIWAFGCVVFEMLTGRPPFAAATASDTIAAVLNSEPDWARLPAPTPPLAARMLRRCLQKDVDVRQRDIADAAADLESPAISVGARAPTRRWPGWVGGAAAGALIVAGAFAATRNRSTTFDVSNARLEQLTFDTGLTDMPAVSPDGRLLAYASDRAGAGDLDLWIEQTAGGAPIRLTDNRADDHQPSFSPDGREIVFRSERDGGALYVMPALGGTARRLVDGGRAPQYSPDGHRIAYWTGSWRGRADSSNGKVFVLDLDGGEPREMLPGFEGVREPVWSPDGRALLVIGQQTNGTPLDLIWVPTNGGAAVRTGALDRNDLRADVSRMSLSSSVVGAWTAEGVLISAASGLWLVPISPSSGALRESPKQLTLATGRHLHAVAEAAGRYVFAMAEAPRVIERAPLNDFGPAALVHTDSRSGPSRPSQTPDGSRVLYDRGGPGYTEFWIKQDGAADRLIVRASESSGNAVISPDGSTIAYTSADNGIGEGFTVNVDRGVPARFCESCSVFGFLSNSRTILIADERMTRLRALDLLTGQSRIILQAPSAMGRLHLSPDDRHVAFNFDGKQWIATVHPDRPTPQSEWQEVDQHTVGPRACGWSIDSQIAYLLLDTDGFRCLWGQRIDPKTGGLVDKPFAVRHFHHTVTQEFSTSFGNAIGTAGFLYGGGNLKANLWRLTLPR